MSGNPSLHRPPAAVRERLAGLGAGECALMRSALASIAAGRHGDALPALERVSSLAPAHPEVLRLLAIVRYRAGAKREAVAMLRRALAGWPDDAILLSVTGGILGQLGEHDEALRMLRAACRSDPGMAAAWFNRARCEDATGDAAGADVSLRRALAVAPDHLDARTLHANVLATLGDIAEAAAEFRRVIARAPDFAEAWIGLADLKTVRLGDDEVAALKRLHASRALAGRQRAAVAFALGKACEDQRDFEHAFALVGEANAIIRRDVDWDAAALSREVDAIEEAFPVAPAATDTFGSQIIFIVSLPRSGSTLLEQMLAAHPDVHGSGELSALDSTLADESRRRGRPFAAWASEADAVDWRRLGNDYLCRGGHMRTPALRSTDKALDNWRYVGAAMAMLPGARFLEARREPIETGWSCFKHRFGAGRQLYSYDLADIGAYWREYDRLTRHWRRIAPERFRAVDYEALLADTETTLRDVLAFLGLGYDEACLRFHELKRPVRTASAAQVREPLRRDTARSANYGSLLDPLRRALGQIVSPP